MSKKLMLIISSIVAIVSVAIAALIIKANDYDPGFKESYSLDLSSQSKLAIKESKLFDESKNEFVEFDKTIKDEFKLINIYDTDNYYFVVFSNNQDSLVNDMYLVETSSQFGVHNYLYMIDKNTGKASRILAICWNNGDFRVDLSNIKFISEDLLALEMYSLTDASPYNLYMIKIINTDKVFTTIDTQFYRHSFFENTYLYEKYCITNDKCIIKYRCKDTNLLGIYKIDPTYTYELHQFKGTYRISQSSCNISKKSILEKYENEQYLVQGYFAYYQNTIVYLDNDLNVKELDTDSFIEKLSSKEEFKSKYF